MNVVLLATSVAFVVSIVVPEAIRWRTDNFRRQTVSHYLTGTAGVVEDLGFVAMAAGLFELAASIGWRAASIAAVVSGCGILGAMVSDRFPGWFLGQQQTVHVASAGIAFVAAGVMMFTMPDARALLALAVAYPVLGALMLLLAPHRVAVTEKLVIAIIAMWVIAYATVR